MTAKGETGLFPTDLSEPGSNTWWGDYSLALQDSLLWRIGPFALQVQRREKEWLIWHLQKDTDEKEENTWSREKNICLNNGEGDLKRYVFSQTEEALFVLPRLADRPVVAKATMPLNIQAGQQVEMYVSTPLWFSVSVHSIDATIQETPIIRPSDTWFGPSTMKGELCYASTTHGRLSLTDLPLRPHRAITQVKIDNQADKPLILTQLSLPTQYLSLFDTGEGGLWTEAVTLLNDDDSDLAKVSFSDSPPLPYMSAQQIVKARHKKENNMLLHTFSALFR